MVGQGKILGHIVSANGISLYEEKVKVIVDLPWPIHAKGEQIFFWDHVGYIVDSSHVSWPLYTLLIVFESKDKCEQAFQHLKNALISTSILKAPNWSNIFHVHIDALVCAIWCILAQLKEHKMDLPMSYASTKLNDT